jgi:hypothetical protein
MHQHCISAFAAPHSKRRPQPGQTLLPPSAGSSLELSRSLIVVPDDVRIPIAESAFPFRADLIVVPAVSAANSRCCRACGLKHSICSDWSIKDVDTVCLCICGAAE